MKRRVAVVGGGIAGLAAAAGLDRHRFDVTVYEASPERADRGSALGMWPSARRALASIGALDGVLAAGWQINGGAIRDLNGTVLVRAPGVDLLMVDRATLLRELEAALPESVHRVSANVTDPSALEADVVIGADGVRSRVRPLVLAGSGERRRTPWVALRGLSDGRPDPDQIGEYWGPGRLFGIAPLGDDRCYWFSAHRSALGPDPLDPGRAIEEAARVFAEAAPAIRERLADADQTTLANRLWVAPAMARYAAGRYVVIGDAAHAMAPNLGRGACEAIVDGVSLAETLNRGGRLLGWQARRVPATQAARVASDLMMRLALSSRLQPARDAALTALGRARRHRPGHGA